ncbi:DUF2778 domain-containing protein [Bradyrhizobium sp. UFLA05-112]
MVSDAARAKKLLSRRRIGRPETLLLSLAAVALSVGAVAWIAYGNGTASLASAALPPSGPTTSFEDRFQPSSPPRDAGLRSVERSAVSMIQLKLRDAKALLAQQLVRDDWRSTLTEDDKQVVEATAPPLSSQKPDVPMPRSRPVQADLASQVASSQAFADSLPKGDNRSLLQKFSDMFPGKVRLASLTPDSGLFRQGPDLAALGYNSQTAVYDISAKAVYLPGGVALEAHSGMGAMMDDPDHVDQRMVGATPPATYELKPREKLFHGVRALRMTPVDGTSALGRVGLLTHSYMLGPRGDSNGCVSIKFYDRFLKAYDDGEINRLIVVPNLKGATSVSQRASASDS